MEFQDVVRKRRMIRRFTTDPVAPEAVDRMLRNAVRAPNAGFSQGWAFLVLDRPEDVDRFWRVSSPPTGDDQEMSTWLSGMRTAPVIIVALTSKDAYLTRYSEDDKGWKDRAESRWTAPYWHVDAGMASLLILQTVVDEGLGACFFGIPAEQVEGFLDEFGIPREFAPTGVIGLGHPDEPAQSGSPTRRRRKSLDEVVHRGGW